MSRTKMMLFTVLVAALAVPSLWAQKKHEDEAISRMSIKQIKHLLQARAKAAGVPAACLASSLAPPTYLAATNKCSSGNADLGTPSTSLQGGSSTCSDKGGVEATFTVARTVGAVGPGQAFAGPWNSTFTGPSSIENSQPDVYGDSIFIQSSIEYTLKRPEGVTGFEFSNLTPQTYDVTFSNSTGVLAVAKGVPAGGTVEPDPAAARVVAVCNVPAITNVLIECTSCSELNGDGTNWIAQIRGDKFLGF